MAASGGHWKGGAFVASGGGKTLIERHNESSGASNSGRSLDRLLRRENELYSELLSIQRSYGGDRPTRSNDKRRWNAIQRERNSINDEAIMRFGRGTR